MSCRLLESCSRSHIQRVSGIAVQNKKRRPRPATRVVVTLGALVTLTALGAGISVWRDVTAFEASMRKVYALPVPLVSRSVEPRLLAHGKQLAESVASCTAVACHGADLAGGRTFNIGPLATISGPNISGAALASYTDGELARLIQRGVIRDGRSVLFMPVQSMCHGQLLSGGAIPGAPSSTPVPSNLTSDASGLQAWTFDDFERLLTTRRRRNGKALDPFMPTDAFAKYDSMQMHALWSYLRSIPPRPIGQR